MSPRHGARARGAAAVCGRSGPGALGGREVLRGGVLATVGLSAALAMPRAAEACAGCRNPTLPVTRGSSGALPAGSLRWGANATATAVHVVHEAGCRDPTSCSEVPVQPEYLHDQRLYPVELRLLGEYGVTRALGVELQIPFRAVRTTIDYSTPEGAPYQPLDPGVHHRNEVVAGPADPWVLLRFSTGIDRTFLAVRPGVSLPAGSTEPDPFAAGDRGERHQHIQLGSGTVDPLLVLEVSTRGDAWSFQAFAQGTAPLYANRHGYQAPWRAAGGATVGYPVLTHLRALGGIEAFHEAPERWGGTVRQDGSLGRTELLAALGATLTIDRSELSLSVRLPVVRHIVQGEEPPGELSSPAVLGLGVTTVHDLAGR